LSRINKPRACHGRRFEIRPIKYLTFAAFAEHRTRAGNDRHGHRDVILPLIPAPDHRKARLVRPHRAIEQIAMPVK